MTNWLFKASPTQLQEFWLTVCALSSVYAALRGSLLHFRANNISKYKSKHVFPFIFSFFFGRLVSKYVNNIWFCALGWIGGFRIHCVISRVVAHFFVVVKTSNLTTHFQHRCLSIILLRASLLWLARQTKLKRGDRNFRCVFFIVGALIINGLFLYTMCFSLSTKNDLLGYMVMQ